MKFLLGRPGRSFASFIPLFVLLARGPQALAQSEWTQRNTGRSPTPRGGHAMAYDSARERLVLFGGINGLQPEGDTWEWNGATWVNVSPSPPHLTAHAMAYDSDRGRVVLFGGIPPGGGIEGPTPRDACLFLSVGRRAPPPAGDGSAGTG